MFKCVILGLLTLSLPALLYAQQLAQEFEISSEVKIHLPAGWTKITNAETMSRQQNMRSMGVGLGSSSKTYVFESSSGPKGLPFITVNLARAYVPPVKDADELLDSIKEALGPEQFKEAEDKAAGLVKNTTMDDLYYDEVRQSVGMRVRMRLPDGSSITDKVEIFFVRGGYVQLNFYTNSAQDNELFEAIADGLQIDPSFRSSPIGASKTWGFINGLGVKTKIALVVFILSCFSGLLKALNNMRGERAARKISSYRGIKKYVPEEQREKLPSIPEPAQPQYLSASRSTDDPALVQMRQAVEKCQAVLSAELYEQKRGSLPAELVLALCFREGVPLKEQQTTIKTLREQIPAQALASIVRQEYIRSLANGGAGLMLLSRKPAMPAAPKIAQKTAQAGQAKPKLKLELE